MKKIAVLALCMLSSAVFAVQPGDEAPKFANPDLEGVYFLSKNVVGGDWLIIDFFATWCEPCKEEIPELINLYDEYSSHGLKLYMFATDAEAGEVVKPFFAQTPVPFPVLLDPYQVTSDRFGVEALPTLLVINPEGVVEMRMEGFDEEKLAELQALLEERLK